jgi:hypothetical protein
VVALQAQVRAVRAQPPAAGRRVRRTAEEVGVAVVGVSALPSTGDQAVGPVAAAERAVTASLSLVAWGQEALFFLRK